MVKYCLIVLFGCTLLNACETRESTAEIEVINTDSISLIPYPNSIQIDSGHFEINSETIIQSIKSLENEYNYLNNLLSNSLIDSLKVLNGHDLNPNRIQFE